MYRKNDISRLVAPVAILVLGLVLLINPDSASALLSRAVGWILTVSGLVVGLSALLGDRRNWIRQGFTAGVLLVVGAWLRANPLAIAAWAGRLVGIILLIQGLPDLLALGLKDRKAVITTAVGAVLILVPMATSRVLISLVGVVVICVGAAMLVDRLRHREPLEEGRPDIIDADE